MDSLRGGESELVNTNKLLRNYDGCTGLKTGSTSLALFNLSATATRDDLSLIAVIMKGETSAVRFAEAKKLLDYGFSNFEYYKYSNKGDVVKNLMVNKGTTGSVTISFESDAGALIPKGQSANITTTVALPEIIEAPVVKGQKIGEVIFSLNAETLGTVNLIANDDVKKLSFGNMLAHVVESWFTLLR